MKPEAIIKACVEAGEEALAADFIAAGITPKRLAARLEEVAYVRQLATIACRVQPALPETFSDELVALNVGVEEVQAIIGERLVAEQSPEIFNHLPIADDPKRGNHGWDKVLADAAAARRPKG